MIAQRGPRSDKLLPLHLHPASLPISSTLMNVLATMMPPYLASAHLPPHLVFHALAVAVAECEQPPRPRPRRLRSRRLRIRLRLLPIHCPFRNLSRQRPPISSHALVGMPLHVPPTLLHLPSSSIPIAGRVHTALTSSTTAARPTSSVISRPTRKAQTSRCGYVVGCTRQTR